MDEHVPYIHRAFSEIMRTSERSGHMYLPGRRVGAVGMTQTYGIICVSLRKITTLYYGSERRSSPRLKQFKNPPLRENVQPSIEVNTSQIYVSDVRANYTFLLFNV